MRRILVVALSLLLVLASANPANAAYQAIEGTGSTWSANIVAQWIASVQANGMQVTYTPNGSSQGRKNFANFTNDFGITEIPYQGTDEYGNSDTSGGRPFAYVPIVAGGTAFTYQLRIGGKLVKNLRLSGETITKIFTQQITNWNDPAIKADNNGRVFPSLKISPVVRSDGSGTTAQFTAWMNNQYPDIWKAYFGKNTLTSYYPAKNNMKAASGSDQVMNTVKASTGNGTIGYVEYSYPVNANYPVVKVLNKGGYFVEPTQYNVAVALTQATFNNDDTQNLTGVYNASDPRAYPLSSYSYLLLPTGTDAQDRRMSTAKRQTLMDFLYYSLCQGQQKAGAYGYSPLPLNLVQKGFSQLAKLKDADPNVNVADRSVTSCNNPTFAGADLSKNKLAQIAPQPQSCDKQGQGPCGFDTGTAPTTTQQAQNPSAGATAPTTGAAPNPGATPSAAAAVDPANPQAAADPAAAAGAASSTDTTQAGAEGSAAVPLDLASARKGDRTAFGVVAALELLVVILLPGLLALYLRRRTPSKGGA